MSNYYNLPRQAAFKITTINGKRCTAVPRSGQATQASTTAAAAASKETKTSTLQKSTQQVQESQNQAVPTTVATPLVPDTDETNVASNPVGNTTSSPFTIPTPEAIADLTATNASQKHPNATTAPSSGTNDKLDKSTTAKSSGQVAGTSPTPTNRNTGGTDTATLGSAPSDMRTNPAPIVGGVVGTLILLAIIGVLLFICRRRRRKKFVDPLLSPETATREKFYEIDTGSLGPTKRSTRWKREISSRAENVAWDLKATVAGFGTSMKATVSRDRGDTPSVDLDRGNSQFVRGSFNSHNRNPSSALSADSRRSSVREKLAEWRKRFGESFAPQKQVIETGGPMSQVGSMPDSRAATALDRYRDSDQSGSTATKDLGLSLMNSQTSDLLKLENQPRDPFADPYADPFCDPKHGSLTRTKINDLPPSNPFAAGDNPFSDPVITNPPSIVPKPQTYVQQVRRSRGASTVSSMQSSQRSSRSTDLISFIDRPRSVVSLSQFPSVAAPSHTYDRDTIYSSFSTERRGKGRSDPFDLERPDLWILPSQERGSTLSSPTSSAVASANRIRSMIDQNKSRAHHRHNSSIRYSSGVDSLEDWGDPADYVDVTASSSVRGNASSQGGNEDYGSNDLRTAGVNKIYSNQAINGSLTEINVTLNEDFGRAPKELERRKNVDNVSPVSTMGVLVEGKTA